MKSAVVSLLLVIAFVANLAAQDVVAPPRKYKSAEECFAALQKATQSDPVDFATVIACQSAAMNNVQVGQIAFHLTRGAFFQVLPKKDVDPFLIKHNLADVDIFEVLQIASSPNGMGELRAFNMIGARITDKGEFLKGSAAWMKTYAEKSQPEEAKKPAADKRPVLKLAKLETTGDAAQADIVDKDGNSLGQATFRLIDGSWVLGFPGKEPRVPTFTKAQREALAKLDEKGHVQMGKEDEDFALRTSLDQANDDDLRLLQGLSFQMIRLNGGNITDAGLKHLDSQPALEGLFLSDTKVSEAGVLALTKHKQLKTLEIGNLDLSSAALAQLKTALPKCEIQHFWNWPWLDAGGDTLNELLKHGPVLLVVTDESTDRRSEEWRKKLHTREGVQFGRKNRFAGLIVHTDSEFSKPPPGIDPKKNPQFFLYPSAGAKPVELTEKSTGAELLAAIQKALGK